MMSAINGVMLAIGSSFPASILTKMTVTTTLGLAASWLARSDRAAVRHALLAATFGMMLLLPIVSFIMPPLHIGVSVSGESRPTLLPLLMGATSDPSVPTTGAGSHVTPAAPNISKLSLSNMLLSGWAAGAALFLLPVVAGMWQIRSLRRSGLPWRGGQLVVEALAPDTGIRRSVEVLLHEALSGPMTCGAMRPAIVLPRDAENWDPEDLNRAIVHELEHVRRWDSVSRCFARIVCAAYWFHPLVWIAWHQLMLEAERSCDDAVLRRSEATAYADQLVGLAKRLATTKTLPVLAMANRLDLRRRVSAVLDNRQRRGRAGTIPVALAGTAAAVVVFTLAPLMLVAEPQPTSAQSAKETDRRAANNATAQFLIDQLRQAEKDFRAALRRDGDVEPLGAAVEMLRKSLSIEEGVERLDQNIDRAQKIVTALAEGQIYDRKLSRIEVRGLSGAIAKNLISKLSVHKGDAVTPDLIRRTNEATTEFDRDLESFVSVEPDGSCMLQIRHVKSVR